MYFKCSYCGSKISNQPLYYTSDFLGLKPGFSVYCNAACSLSDYEDRQGLKFLKKVQQNSPS